MNNSKAIMMGGKKVRLIYVQRLTKPYPPIHKNIVETPEAMALWAPFLKKNPLSDKRAHRDNQHQHYSVTMLDESKLAYIVKEGERVIFIDQDTGKVAGAAIENVIEGNDMEDILHTLTQTVIEYTNNTIGTIRMDDPGYMVTAGYTSGPQNNRQLQWAENLREGVDSELQARKVACLFSFIQEKVEPFLPKEVFDDFEKARERIGGLVMHTGEKELKYVMHIGGKDVAFKTTKFAPASGQCTINYGRYTHNEANANKFCYHSTLAELTHKLTVWIGQDYHGTTLMLADPLDQNASMKTVGVSFILNKHLAGEVNRLKLK